MCRLNTNWSIDTSFNPGVGPNGGANNTVYFVEQINDGQNSVLVGGLFTSYNQTYGRSLARLLSHGTLDTDFMDRAYCRSIGFWQEAPQNDSFITAARLEASGDIIAAGFFDQVGGWDNNLTETDTAQNEVNERPLWDSGSTNPRKNFCRLIGGSTSGPGQMQFTSSTYSVDEFVGSPTITITRQAGHVLGWPQVDLTVVGTKATP